MAGADEYHQMASPFWPCLECKILTVLYVRYCLEDMVFSSDYRIPSVIFVKKVLCCKQYTNRVSVEIL
jgi:hypothetical protein